MTKILNFRNIREFTAICNYRNFKSSTVSVGLSRKMNDDEKKSNIESEKWYTG